MSQSLAAVYIHLVFSTKLRQTFLSDAAIRAEMHAYLGGISSNMECAPLTIGGVADHVHILARLGRSVAISDWVRELKRSSNVWVRSKVPDFEWQAGYAGFSVSVSNLDAGREYVETQEAHHRRMSFQDELRILLKKHKLEMDERYVWD